MTRTQPPDPATAARRQQASAEFAAKLLRLAAQHGADTSRMVNTKRAAEKARK